MMNKEIHWLGITCIVTGMILGLLDINGPILYKMIMNAVVVIAGVFTGMLMLGLSNAKSNGQ